MLATGNQAPDFSLRKVGGAMVSLREILRGRTAVIAFFKVSCPVCQLAFPFLAKMAASENAQFIGVSQDDETSTQRFLSEYGVKFTTLLDDSGRGYPASNAYGIKHVPTIFVVEGDGAVARAWSGFSRKDMEQLGELVEVKPFGPDDADLPGYKPG